MKSAITKENVLPNAMLRDVLVANPQSTKSVEVLQKLDERDDPMPAYMMDQIMQGQNYYGHKELLEQKLARHKTKKGISMTKLLHSYLADTTDFAGTNDSITGLLETDNELYSHYQLTMKYLGMRDSANAYSTFYNIPVEFDVNTKQEEEYDLYEDLIDLQWQMMNDTTMPDSLIVDDLLDIEQYYNTVPGIYARNILIGLGELEYDEPIYFPDFTKSTAIKQFDWPQETKNESRLRLFPNPAGAYFIVEYELIEFEGEIALEVIDLRGIVKEKKNLKGKQNQFMVATNDYNQGIYIVKLLVNGLLIETVKITITK